MGQKVREGRKRITPSLSQDKLAHLLGISRASVVNIEAGRQHAPLHLLWQIADVLDVDVIKLIPQPDELLTGAGIPTQLNESMRKHIESESKNNPALEKSLTNVVEKLLATIETTPSRVTDHENYNAD
ncbi:MAG: helix-turn-helix domain-containing protein [Janthinobacterium lividum]